VPQALWAGALRPRCNRHRQPLPAGHPAQYDSQRVDSPRQREYRPGSPEDFDRLYAATYHRLLGTLIAVLRDRAAAEDCAQDTYLRAFQAWPRWRPNAPAEAWLHRIAINVAVSHRRRERLREAGEVFRRLGLPAAQDPTEQSTPELLRELRALPPKQSAALVLRHVHGYTNREIAHALDVPERTVASRLAAARSRLQERLGWMRAAGTWLPGGVASEE
jgi:RNA polymerase sigma-70 factor, ECF subfamily